MGRMAIRGLPASGDKTIYLRVEASTTVIRSKKAFSGYE